MKVMAHPQRIGEKAIGDVRLNGKLREHLYDLLNARDYLQGKTLVVEGATKERKIKAGENGMRLPTPGCCICPRWLNRLIFSLERVAQFC
jgi:hypothetical protein